MRTPKETKGILNLKERSEADKIDFELDYLMSLTVRERFRLTRNKSLEIINLLVQNERRNTPAIIKRQSPQESLNSG
jgi:hypothetical protein